MAPIKLLIVDDSALVRSALTEVFNSVPEIEVIDTAGDPYIAVKKIQKQKPDVISLDLEMPRMDGITFLKKLMSQRPIPVVICSSLTEKGSDLALKAMDYGAIEVIQKPKLAQKQFFYDSKVLLVEAIKAAAEAGKSIRFEKDFTPQKPKKETKQIPTRKYSFSQTTDKVILIGASTGGTKAIREIIGQLPPDIPGIVITQHMPEHFTKSFAKSLNNLSEMRVAEAKDGDMIKPGKALIAPGNYHTMIKRSGAKYFTKIKQGPLVNRSRPSVDVLFNSGARYVGKNAMAIILTGMGADGAKGMLNLKEKGTYTVAQDEKTSIIFGMPKKAIELGGVDKVLPLDKIVTEILNTFNQKN